MELKKESTKVEPIAKEAEQAPTLRAGHIQIKLKDKEGVVEVHESHFPSIYPESEWELVSGKKK